MLAQSPHFFRFRSKEKEGRKRGEGSEKFTLFFSSDLSSVFSNSDVSFLLRSLARALLTTHDYHHSHRQLLEYRGIAVVVLVAIVSRY